MESILIPVIVPRIIPANIVKRMWMNARLMRTFAWMELLAQIPTETILVFASTGKLTMRNRNNWESTKEFTIYHDIISPNHLSLVNL